MLIPTSWRGRAWRNRLVTCNCACCRPVLDSAGGTVGHGVHVDVGDGVAVGVAVGEGVLVGVKVGNGVSVAVGLFVAVGRGVFVDGIGVGGAKVGGGA